MCLLVCIAFRAVIFVLFGPVILAANLLATFMAFIGPLLVNTIAHLRRFGYESYQCGDNSRNVWWVAMLSRGEGWHNNHHAFPQSARHGLTPREVDPTWMVFCLLKAIGLAKKIRLPKNQCRLAFVDALLKSEREYVTTTVMDEH